MFAGPGVIKRTIGEDLPEGFQTANYLLKKGFVDRIIHRKHHREELSSLLSILLKLDKPSQEIKDESTLETTMDTERSLQTKISG